MLDVELVHYLFVEYLNRPLEAVRKQYDTDYAMRISHAI